MAKGYEDLSRRALVKLGKDYDQDNDAALLQYLTDHNDEYEGIRPIEKAVDRVDQVKDTLSASKSIIKSTFVKQADNILDAVVDALAAAANVAGVGIDDKKENV